LRTRAARKGLLGSTFSLPVKVRGRGFKPQFTGKNLLDPRLLGVKLESPPTTSFILRDRLTIYVALFTIFLTFDQVMFLEQ